MPFKTLERIKDVIKEAEANAHEAVASAPIGFVMDSLHSAWKRRQHTMNVALVGSFNTDYQDQQEAAAVSQSVIQSLAGTVLKDADVLVIETLHFLDGPSERETRALGVTARNLSQASQERLEGVVTVGSIDVLGSMLTPELIGSYLPRAEAKALGNGQAGDPTVAYVAVANAARLDVRFGLSPADDRDGGITHLVDTNSWQKISQGGRLGMYRQGML